MDKDSIHYYSETIPKGFERQTRIVEERKQPKPPFMCVGTGKENYKGGKSMNLVYEMSVMTPQELWLFNLIEVHRKDYDDNQSYVASEYLTDPEKQKLKIGYKRLRDKDLVRRIKRENYMINPRLIIPQDWKKQEEYYLTLK